MSFEIYRRSTIGECLTDALDELIRSSQITPQLAIRVLVQFDKSMGEGLTKIRQRMVLRGHLSTYRYLDDVWTFFLDSPNIRLTENGPNQSIDASSLRIIACRKPGEGNP